MNELFTGEYTNILDEKGRIMIPVKMRGVIEGNSLIITRGIDACLMVFPLTIWRTFSEQLFKSFSLLEKRFRLLQRKLIAPAQECPLDRSGRVRIPQTLAEAAHLKKECTILGMQRYIELWDSASYQKYFEIHDQEFIDAAEQLGKQLGGLLSNS